MKFWAICLLLITFSGCATQPAKPPVTGEIVGLEPFVAEDTSTNWIGAGAGGIIGGLVGHTFGKGNGKTAATVLGAGVGAAAGSQVAKPVHTVQMVKIWVKDSQGVVYKIPQAYSQTWNLHQKVQINTGFLGQQTVVAFQ